MELVSARTHFFGSSELQLLSTSPHGKNKTIRYQTGASQERCSLRSINSTDYVKKNFPGEKVVIPYLHTMDKTSLSYNLARKFVEVGEQVNEEKYVLLAGVNMKKHLENTFRLKGDLIKENFEHLQDNHDLMIFYPPSSDSVILVTLPKGEKESLHNLFFKAHENMKSYLLLHEDLLQTRHLNVINVIAAPHHKQEKVENSSHCQDCVPFILFSEDLASHFDEWWNQIEEYMNRNEQEIIDQGSMFEISSRSILLEAIIDDNFPCFRDKDEEIFRKKIINKSQIDVLLDNSLQKLITGKSNCLLDYILDYIFINS